MPVILAQRLTPLSQAEFSQLAYSVLGQVFEIHRDLGRLFSESIYKRALAEARSDVTLEFPIDLTFQGFAKRLFLDVVVGTGGVFEFKAVDAFHPRHRAQLLQYLMLADLRHGMLINVRSGHIEKEFVNNVLPGYQRRNFEVSDEIEPSLKDPSAGFRELLIALLCDWGLGLDVSLYEEVMLHCLGGESAVVQSVTVNWKDTLVGQQAVRLLVPEIAFKITAFDKRESCENYGDHLRRLLAHTHLRGIVWANIGRHSLTFRYVRR